MIRLDHAAFGTRPHAVGQAHQTAGAKLAYR